MTETKYILTGDETHPSGRSVRELYKNDIFPLSVTYYAENIADNGSIYVDASEHRYAVAHDSEVKPKEAGHTSWFFVAKDGERINMPTPVSGDLGFDPVDKPEHYSKGMPEGVEVIDVIRSQGWESNFYLANAAKYLLRCEHKGNKRQDLEKMMQFVRWELDRLDG